MKFVTVFAIICCVIYTSAHKNLHDVLRELSFIKSANGTPPKNNEQLKNLYSSKYSTRIIGGKPARKNQFPYQVLFKIKTHEKPKICSGSLITQNYVLTAAHCVYGVIDIDLYIGAQNRFDKNEVGRKMFYIIPYYILTHEDYHPKLTHNDIALIKLPEPVQLSNSVQLIKLADESLNTTDITGIATGWGLTKADGKLSDILRYVDLKVISNEKCARDLNIQPTNLCTDGSTGKSTYSGDSGGPLVVKYNGSYVQIGITSFGNKKPNEWGNPAAYTKVSSFLKWIVENTDYKL